MTIAFYTKEYSHKCSHAVANNHVVRSICLLMSPCWHAEEMTVCQIFLHTGKQHVEEMAPPLCSNMGVKTAKHTF